MKALRQARRFQTSIEKPKVKKPVDVFKKCPECECANLIPMDGDVLCSSCDWNSIITYADALFDNQIGFLFESDATRERRRQEDEIRQERIRERKEREKEERTQRLMSSLHASARMPVRV